jgi:TetR/AcrR family transcriptional repressor of uid operon
MKNPLLTFMTADAAQEGDAMGAKILDAAFDQFCLVGIKRSSMEDVAKRAGVGRVTIYRRFASKEALVNALLAREVRTAIEKVAAEHEGAGDVETRWVNGFVTGMRAVRRHKLLLVLLETEPEEILPMLTLRAAPGLAVARAFMAQEIKRSRKELGLRGAIDADAVAEMLARLTLSLLLTKDTQIPVDDQEEARRFARRYIVPLVTGGGAKVR